MSTKRTITRKVIPQSSVKEEVKIEKEIPQVTVSKAEQHIDQNEEEERSYRKERVKRECYFCQSKSIPSYTNLANLRRYLTDRAKIVGKERSGACSKHQRGVTKNIKYARHLSLLPFVPEI